MATMPALPAGAEDYDTGDGFDEAFEAPGVVREHYLDVLESLAETGVKHAAQAVEARLREWKRAVRRRGDRRRVRGRPGAAPADRRGVEGADDGPAPAGAGARRVRRRHARPAPSDRRRGHPRSRRRGLRLPGGRPAWARAGRRRAHRDRGPRRRARPRRSLQGARGQRPHPVGQRVRPGGVGGGRGGGADPRATRGRGRVAAHGAAPLHGGHEPGRGGRARPAHRRARQLRLVRAQAARGGRGPAPRPARRAAAPRRAARGGRRRVPSARSTAAPTRIACATRTGSSRTSRSCCSSRCAPGRSAS